MIITGTARNIVLALLIPINLIGLTTITYAAVCGPAGSLTIAHDKPFPLCITEWGADCGPPPGGPQPFMWCDADYNSNDRGAGYTICSRNNYQHFKVWRFQVPASGVGSQGLNEDYVVCSNSVQKCLGPRYEKTGDGKEHGCWTTLRPRGRR